MRHTQDAETWFRSAERDYTQNILRRDRSDPDFFGAFGHYNTARGMVQIAIAIRDVYDRLLALEKKVDKIT